MTQPSFHQKLIKPFIGPFRMEPRAGVTGIPSLGCIYRITCEALGRHYIGQTSDAARRWLEHQEQLWAGRHPNTALQQAFDQLGHQTFVFAIMEQLPRRYHERTYTLAEQRWLDLHRNRFNVRPAGGDVWLRTTAEGKKAVQAALRAKQERPGGGFHRSNPDRFR